MEQPPPSDLKRRARAAWSHAATSQKDLATATGLAYGTLKGLLREGGPAPDTDQALAIARACGVPDWFILHGWAPPTAELNADRLSQLEAKFDELASRYDDYLTVMREEVEQAVAAAVDAIVQANTESAREKPAKDRPRARTAKGPQ